MSENSPGEAPLGPGFYRAWPSGRYVTPERLPFDRETTRADLRGGCKSSARYGG